MLEVRNLSKRFAGVTALDKVSFCFEQGRVNALIGENGAGKTTLMNILSGAYQDYEGEVLLYDHPVVFANPSEAKKHGIAIIHQELNLITGLSIMENIFLGQEMLTPMGFLDKRAMKMRAASILARLKLFLDPDTLVSDIRVGQQQVVEIAKALLVDADIIIMDEPTSAISDSEIEVLFELIADLRRDGKTIIYISHKLDELFKIADCYFILRDGRHVGKGDMNSITHGDIVRMMAGRDIRVPDRKRGFVTNDIAMDVKHVQLEHPVRKELKLLKNITFHLLGGEILGVYGLMGAGRTELLETLFGCHGNKASGEVYIKGKQILLTSPASAISAGLALVPEDRKNDGLVLEMNVMENISMAVLKDIANIGFINQRKEARLADRFIHELHVKTPSREQMAKNLSGGNQQKLVLSKWLATNPTILMLDEPTRGIDVHAKHEIYQLIFDLARQGIGIIIATSDIEEVLALSDRILAMSEGRIAAVFNSGAVNEDLLVNAVIPRMT